MTRTVERRITRRRAARGVADDTEVSDIPFMSSPSGWCSPQPGFKCSPNCPGVIEFSVAGQRRCPCTKCDHPKEKKP